MARRSPLLSLLPLLGLASTAVCEGEVTRGDGTAYSGKGEKNKTGLNYCQIGDLDENGDIDFSIDALKEVTGFTWDRKRIEWKFVDCESDTKQALASITGWEWHKENRRMLRA
ncbi:hypothetical protein C2E20_4180 [Micractinium conductrix]|uniref:Uncharacterized protein n=1 Tax=Micractinium conductrix TaxID=554055 RepID=A0A2P6VEN7_9CHLO|nr:hypothetical protein C2E20_4180 [Micractinium conductrix]|eukprot:PSC72555.1 hypothetical protein C2E20_4180 [Micractinium conductrix]